MQIHKNFSLKNYNTFGIDANCKRLFILETEDEIIDYFENHNNGNQFLLLGGGSNLLIKNNLDYDVLKPDLQGINVINEDTESVTLEVMAGENWHNFVKYLVNNNYFGFENLALIPGNVGTAPIQNIGAYGVEQVQNFISLRGYNIESKQFETYTKEQCHFGYRSSIFKSELKGKFIITSVTYKLSKTDNPNLSYVELEKYLIEKELVATSKNVFEAVIDIRTNKLPSPSELGNSGSFFKNPIITLSEFDRISFEYSDLRGFPQGDDTVKISAGWLIEKAGLKGYRVGDAAVYDKHALILVNYGNATGSDIWKIAEHVIGTVFEKFQIKLEPEVNVVE
jgi:UDP-N-acetylmuramate dehydrogenase